MLLHLCISAGLHYGARFGHKDIIKFLLLRGPSSLIGLYTSREKKLNKDFLAQCQFTHS
jgi:hypothetical protein